MRNIPLDQIRHTNGLDMKTHLSLTGGSFFGPVKQSSLITSLKHQKKIGGGFNNIDDDELRGGNIFSDVVKGLSFLPIPGISDLARTATLTGLVK